MDPVPGSHHHRHQASLGGIVFLSGEPEVLGPVQRSRAEQKFYRIVRHFEAAEDRTHGSNSNTNNDNNTNSSQCNRPLLVRLTYEYARSRESQDIFLRALFHSMALSLDDQDDVDLECNQEQLCAALLLFADHLFDNFFLPCKDDREAMPLLHCYCVRHADIRCRISACILGQDAPALASGAFCHPARTGG